MISRILILSFLIITSNAFGQTIQELEQDLSVFDSFDNYGDKIEIAKKLQEIDPFNYIATEYICRYYSDRKIDSVSIYFDNLISRFPKNPEPFILRAELLFLEIDYENKDEYNNRQVRYLKQAHAINSQDHSIIFKIAETYYKDFIFPLEKEKDWDYIYEVEDDLIDSTLVDTKQIVKKSTFEHPADSALKYFYQLWDIDKDKIDIIYYPIRQLECFLNKIDNSPISKDSEKNFSKCYFPSSYFADLSDDWECNFTINYLFEIEFMKEIIDYFEVQLIDLEENCLYNKDVLPNTTIYRFTWLRTFHNPIAIRIEKIENEIMLYWKVGKGAGGYEPEGVKSSGKKELNINNWLEFEKLVNESDFDNLPNEKYVPINDGATWTLERKNFESFKAHHTTWPSKAISIACLYLLDLTEIEVKDDEKY